MPRSNRRRPAEPTRASSGSLGERRDEWRGVEYSVRVLSASAGAGKTYRCPGCDQEIRGGGHLVVWPADDYEASDRRHWHTVCWAARDRRAPGIIRSRSAPRF